MPKKVIILTPFYPPQIGGAETFAEELYRQAVKKYDARVCTLQWSKIWRGINWIDSVSVVYRLLIKTIRACNEFKPDTIHALGFNATFIAALLKPIFKYRLVSTVLALYDFSNPLLNILASWSMSRSDVIIAESELSKGNLMRIANANKIKVFTHWVDTARFFPVKRYNEKLRVLFAGRQIREKGIHIIKDVERELKGVDFLYAELIPNTDMPQYYQMADVLVVPSLYAESPNRVVAEGAACGCVVITSDRGALPEQVRDFGFSIKPDVEEFRKAIELLDKDRMWLQLLREDVILYARLNLTEQNAQNILGEY